MRAVTLFMLETGDFDTNIEGAVTVNGNSGNDVLNIDDLGDGGTDAYIITSNSFNKPDFGTGSLNYSSISTFTLDASSPANTINVNSLSRFTSLFLFGNNGSDTFNIGNGDFDTNIDGPVTIDGGTGSDVLNIDDTADGGTDIYTITLNSFTKPIFGTGSLSYSSISTFTVEASSPANTININSLGSSTSLVVNGNGGNDDFIIGNGDFDTNISGSVTVDGNSGTNTLLVEDQNDTGADSYIIDDKAFSKPNFGTGSLQFSNIFAFGLEANNSGNTIDITTKAGAIPQVVVFANGGNDTVNGGETHDTIDGGSGNDTLFGNGGDDTFIGGTGIDEAFGGSGNDTADPSVESFKGGTGQDGILIEGTAGNDHIELDRELREGKPYFIFTINGETFEVQYSEGETITVRAGNGNDRVITARTARMSWVLELFGEAGNDLLIGGDRNDLLDGGAGNDRLVGLGGNDTLKGGRGHDRLLGGEGDDLLDGGSGFDRLIGGLGTDRIFARDRHFDLIFADSDDLLEELDFFDLVFGRR